MFSLQRESAETVIVEFFEVLNQLARHAKRVTVKKVDTDLLLRFAGSDLGPLLIAIRGTGTVSAVGLGIAPPLQATGSG